MSNIKSIIVPHDISINFVNNLNRKYGDNCIKFSDLNNEYDFKKNILIIDSIGILKYLYRYLSFTLRVFQNSSFLTL